MLYGGISTGDIRSQHEAKSGMLDRIEKMAAAEGKSLPGADKQRYGEFVQGFNDMNGLRDRLDALVYRLHTFFCLKFRCAVGDNVVISCRRLAEGCRHGGECDSGNDVGEMVHI